MSGYVGEKATIRGWFRDGWESGVPIHLIEGSAFKDKPTNAPWARLAIRPREARVASVGGPTAVNFRHDGDIILEIFTPDGLGDGRATELADLGCSIIRGKQDGGIVCWSARAIPLGTRDGWVRVNVIGPYQRDEQFSVSS